MSPVRSATAALLSALSALTATAQDAEKTAHGDEAATPQVSFESRSGDFVLRQYQLGCLSQLTYLVGSGGEAAVVDPQRDVDHYLKDAAALGLRITKVILTHTNADFVAGHTELHGRVGAAILISGESHSEFAHQALKDGDKVALGRATLEFWATPGHTLDSMSVLVHAPGAEADPAFVLTGDTLFIGGIGRPDLVGGDATPTLLASKAYDAMQRLAALPDATRILPAHGAGSLCGAHLSPQTVATLGDEKRSNPFLLPQGRSAFVARVLSGLPVAPQYFRYNVALNRKGPPVDAAVAVPPALAPEEVARRMAAGAWVVDLRDGREYAAGHVRGALNVGVRGRLDTWIGIVVPFEADLILFGSDAEVREAAFRLRRIGRDQVVGSVQGGLAAWQAAGQPVARTRLLAPKDLAARIAAHTEPIVVDVRAPAEFQEARIGDYVNLPVTDNAEFARVLDRNQEVVLMCNSAYRSSLAVGLAERQGFTDLCNLDGGLDAWLTAGLPAIGTAPVCKAPGAQAQGHAVTGVTAPVLGEPIEPLALAQGLLDQPGAYVVLDVRPAWQFGEYHVPGAENVAPPGLAARLRSVARTARVVLVDRDGSVASGLAGWLACELGDAAPALRVLTGGTARFWREVELGRAGGGPASAPAATSRPAETAQPVVKKRNAGC